MLTLRCTQRLLTRLRIKPDPAPPPPTTRLGDWYANLLHTSRGQLILCASERSLLPVVVPAKEARRLLAGRLPLALAVMLTNLGVPQEAIRAELSEMEPLSYAKTASRVVLGMMNDFAFHLEHDLADGYDTTQAILRIAEMPCSPIGMDHPAKIARALLVGGRVS